MEKPDPKLRRHKGKSLGYVRLKREDYYFVGDWPEGSKVAPAGIRRQYASLIAEWLAGDRKPLPKADRRRRPKAGAVARADAVPDSVTVAEVALRYLRHAQEYYRDEDGERTSELGYVRESLRPLVHLFGGTAADAIDAQSLRAVQRLLIEGYVHPKYGRHEPLCRRGGNGKCGRIRRMFRWAGGEGIVSPSVWHALRCVPDLVAGRTKAKELPPVQPVPVEDVERTIPLLRPSPAGLVRLQLATGCRPGEAIRICLAEIDRSGAVWVWRPRKHKTKWRGHKREIAIGPRGQAAILERVRVRCATCGVEGRPARIGSRDGATCGPCADLHDEDDAAGPWPRREVMPPEGPLFSPAVDAAELREDKRAARKTKVQPSQRDRRNPKSTRRPGTKYNNVAAYNNAIRRASSRAVVPGWTVNQLRHTFATAARAAFGLEAAQVSLGHLRGRDSSLRRAQSRPGLPRGPRDRVSVGMSARSVVVKQ